MPLTYVVDLYGKEIVGMFYEERLQKTDQTEFTAEKLIKRKGDKIYVKWKSNENSFKIWINKKDI